MSNGLIGLDTTTDGAPPYNSNRNNLSTLNSCSTIGEAGLELRNRSWGNNQKIPDWVNIEEVGLDQFFTRPHVAKACWESFCKYIEADEGDLNNYKFVEPSAGMGAFYDLLPSNRRVGIDVVRYRSEFIQDDFLSWQPKKNGYRYVCIGNPPFGYRAWLALAFVNHAAQFCDYVGFILPMAFQSRGKSNTQDRVNGLHLVHSSSLPSDSFVGIDGKSIKVNALWQIWAHKKHEKKYELATCNQFIDLFTVDMRKERLCGQKRFHEADYFLQRTFYKEPPTLVTSFDQVRYVCGYGLVFKREKKKIEKLLRNIDWRNYSNLSTHNCRHISMEHIRKAITDAGFIDV